MAVFGAIPTTMSAAPQLVYSETESMAVEFILNPALAALGQDPFLPNADIITIPRGRNLGIVNPQTATLPAYAKEGKGILTLANGSYRRTVGDAGTISSDVYPIGIAETNYFRTYAERVQPLPAPTKNKIISLPYVQTSNGVYGTIKPGDFLTASFGSVLSENPIPQEVGKFVKWVPLAAYAAHQSGAAVTIPLTSAIYPAFVPRVYLALNAGTVVVPTSVTYAYNTTYNYWIATLNASVTDVLYDYGQTTENVAGQLVDFNAVGNAGGALDHLARWPGWLQWVRDNYGAWQLPPLTVPRPFTAIVGENPTQTAPNTYRLANYPIVPYKLVQIIVTGTQINEDGSTTVLTNYTLPLASGTFLADYTYGQQYILNAVTGVLELDSSLIVSSISVNYSYETAYLDGKLYDAGVLGLTSGQYSGVPGTPANLELFGVLAEMKVHVKF